MKQFLKDTGLNNLKQRYIKEWKENWAFRVTVYSSPFVGIIVTLIYT